VIAAGVVALVAGFIVYFREPPPLQTFATLPAQVPAVDEITVHVSGAVVAPGLVRVPRGARIADVVAAAGGTVADARLDAINLAAPVRDGEQISVPRVGPAAGDPVLDDGRIRLNAATATELESVPGVGPVLATRIVAARDALGGFSAVEDLLDVSGIGEAKLAAMRDFVTVP